MLQIEKKIIDFDKAISDLSLIVGVLTREEVIKNATGQSLISLVKTLQDNYPSVQDSLMYILSQLTEREMLVQRMPTGKISSGWEGKIGTLWITVEKIV
jgi:hypothetical protein